MKLFKTTFYSAIITFIRVASGFIASKVVAIFTGPAGVALIGAFSNFITIVLTVANGAVNTGIIKYTAEYNSDTQKLKELFSTAFKISFYCSIITGVVLIIFAPYFAQLILTNPMFTYPTRVLGFTVLLYALNALFIAILNGKGEIKIYTIVNTLGSIVGLLFTILLVYYYQIKGALYALVLSQTIVFFITTTLLVKSKWFSKSYFNQPFNKSIAIKLSHFSLMAIVSALTVPVSQIVLRNMIILKLGVNAAGYWQGLMRISDGYLMLITTALSTYYLPKLSSLKTNTEIRNEIYKGYKIILPTVFIGCSFIYLFRFFIIKILYTQDFLIMENLFFWQLLGDFFKMSAWIMGYLMLAKALTKLFILTEIIFSISYIVLGYICVHYFMLQGISIAFAINYVLYFIVLFIFFRKLIFTKNDK